MPPWFFYHIRLLPIFDLQNERISERCKIKHILPLFIKDRENKQIFNDPHWILIEFKAIIDNTLNLIYDSTIESFFFINFKCWNMQKRKYSFIEGNVSDWKEKLIDKMGGIYALHIYVLWVFFFTPPSIVQLNIGIIRNWESSCKFIGFW